MAEQMVVARAKLTLRCGRGENPRRPSQVADIIFFLQIRATLNVMRDYYVDYRTSQSLSMLPRIIQDGTCKGGASGMQRGYWKRVQKHGSGK
jgi:hypothetical protein